MFVELNIIANEKVNTKTFLNTDKIIQIQKVESQRGQATPAINGYVFMQDMNGGYIMLDEENLNTLLAAINPS